MPGALGGAFNPENISANRNSIEMAVSSTNLEIEDRLPE